MAKDKKTNEELTAEISNLKIRIRRIESFILGMPSPEEYVQDRDEYEDNDELLEEAKDIIVQYDRASVSLLQRRLRIGYARAERLMSELERLGFVSAEDGSKPREVLIKKKSK